MNAKTLGERITELRTKRKSPKNPSKSLSQDELSELMGVQQRTISKWENDHIGKGDKSEIKTLLKFCETLGCSPDYLLGYSETPFHIQGDIAEATGLSADAIESLIGFCSYRKDLEKQGTALASDHAADYGLITDFISHLIINMDYDIVFRHLNASAWSQIYEEEESRLEIDDQRLNDMAYVNHQIMAASELHDKAISNRDTSDATAWRFSQMATEVLDSFSEQQVPFVKDHIKKSEAEYERYLYEKSEKESEQMITEREV